MHITQQAELMLAQADAACGGVSGMAQGNSALLEQLDPSSLRELNAA